jgi:hypothetical protein
VRVLALVVALAVSAARAEPPADAPLTVRVKEGVIRTKDGAELHVGPGTFQNDVAAVNTAKAVAKLEGENTECKARLDKAQTSAAASGIPVEVVGAILGVAVVGAFGAGVAYAKLTR